jgi:hypothetical protein
MTATCVIVNVVTPANVASNLLTVDLNSCEAPCTRTGTVRWTNAGGTASVATNLQITVNGTPTTIATGVIIPPGGTTSIYPFSVGPLAKGVYTIATVPVGAPNQVITVVNPAHITAKTIESNQTTCTAPCSVTISVTWENTGDVTGNFVPNITVDGTPATPTYTSEPLAGLATSTVKTFTIPGLTAANHEICPIPN